MDMMRKFFELLPWRGREARPPVLEASPFRKLPLEIIFHIASFLAPESAGAFTISCHALYERLEVQCLQSLKTAEPLVLMGFLHLLERDLPGHLLCPHCNKPHLIRLAKKHTTPRHTGTDRLACYDADRRNKVERSIHFLFSSTIFRMAMKVHRQGQDTKKLTTLLSHRPTTWLHHGYVEQRSAMAKIQDSSLLVREQRIYMIPSSQEYALPWDAGVAMCLYIDFFTLRRLHIYGIQIPNSNEIEAYENRQGIIYCEYCYTEFRIDFKSYGEVGNAMFITRWMDLGAGRDLGDSKWESRIWNRSMITMRKVSFTRGSICASFEQKAASEFKFDSLLTPSDEKSLRNKSYLAWPEDPGLSFNSFPRYCVVR